MILQAAEMPPDLTDNDIARVISAFYARVRDDPEIGPLFNAAIGDWPHHLDRLIAFWSSVMLTTATYKGNPMVAHLKHRAMIVPGMFDRWLELWDQVTGDLLDPGPAQAMQAKARTIAESLKLALYFRLDRQAVEA